MRQIFVIRYRIHDATFELRIQARDWAEAEAMLACIKENGKLCGTVCSSCVDPDVAYADIREGDSLSEH